MSDLPLYYRNLAPKNPSTTSSLKHIVNPLNFLPKSTPTLHSSTPVNPSILMAQFKSKKIGKETKYDRHKNYRTRMCPYGRDCRKRFTCTFAHSDTELRRPFIKRKNACVLFQRGKCSLGSACRDYHGNLDLVKKYAYKDKLCDEFQRKGTCSKGDVCIFLHHVQF